MRYVFEVQGRESFECVAEGPLEAYGLANDHFRASALPQGVWMETAAPVGVQAYRWTLGNFFD